MKQATAFVAVFATAFALIAYSLMPAQAFAVERTFQTPSMNVTAQVQTNGSMHVVEHRAFLFNGEFDSLRWQFTGLPTDAKLSIASVRMAQTDKSGKAISEWTTLQPATFDSTLREVMEGSADNITEKLNASSDNNSSKNSEDAPRLPAPNTWALDERQNTLYVFFQQTANELLFEVDYSVTNAVAAYDDVAEMYWDYVPARDDTETRDISATVQLPVPEGADITPNETVLAWGHGARGEFDIGLDGTITYTVPSVPEGQYANAHILFPTQWLPNLTVEAKQAHSGTRLDDARTEEGEWADTWSNSLVNALGLNIAVLVICAIALLASGGAYLALGREPRRDQLPTLSSEEVTAIEADTELLARFLSWDHISENEADPEAVTARLSDAGLFDQRSFKTQKVLAIAALILIAFGVISVVVFGNWLAFGAFVVTGLCVGFIANYIPRRTPKGVALAIELGADNPRGCA